MTFRFFRASIFGVRYALSVVTREPLGEMKVTKITYTVRQCGETT